MGLAPDKLAQYLQNMAEIRQWIFYNTNKVALEQLYTFVKSKINLSDIYAEFLADRIVNINSGVMI